MHLFVLLSANGLAVSTHAQDGKGSLESQNLSIVMHEIREGVPIGEPSSGVLLRGEVPKSALPDPNLRVIPNCERAGIRREQVGAANMGNVFSLDFVVFSDDDREQIDEAKTWQGPALIYRSGQAIAQVAEDEPLLPFISTLDIRCLPTRFHYVNEKGRQFAEYREGHEAWTRAQIPVATVSPGK